MLASRLAAYSKIVMSSAMGYMLALMLWSYGQALPVAVDLDPAACAALQDPAELWHVAWATERMLRREESPTYQQRYW
jgi:hypothetical protein